MRELLEFAGLDALTSEGATFMTDQEKYLAKVAEALTNNADADIFFKSVANIGGGLMLFGAHWMLALMSELQRATESEDWLEKTLASRDAEFYKTQAGLADAKFSEFASRSMDAGNRNFFLKNHITTIASALAATESEFRHFRVGALFTLELLLRIEEADARAMAQELRRVIN